MRSWQAIAAVRGRGRCGSRKTLRGAYYVRFHQPLQVNSAVRTVAYQLRLRRVNGNAAGIGGEMASPHLTGEAIDFGKHDMSTEEIAWMRTYLRPLMQVGKVDVEEEFQQACFHISVYRSYAPGIPSSRREYAALAQPTRDAGTRGCEISKRILFAKGKGTAGNPAVPFQTLLGFSGTFSPFLRASDKAMAMACFGLVTFLPLPPLFSLP